MKEETLNILERARVCNVCAGKLPHKPRPVFSWHSDARIVVIGQAPGRRVHESGVPWQDASGRLLREWMDVSEETFYDAKQISLLPMGFCFPGAGQSGDLPPRPECAPLWHEAMFQELNTPAFILLVGRFAQSYYLHENGYKTLTENVRRYHEFLPQFLPLPHPSPRNRHWLSSNPWFEETILPELRRYVRGALAHQ